MKKMMLFTPHFIVNWPKGIKNQKNAINKGVGHVMDIMPTYLELADAKYPYEINYLKTDPLDGKNLMPLILEKTNSVHDTLYREHQGEKQSE